jgi:hypothetical protein
VLPTDEELYEWVVKEVLCVVSRYSTAESLQGVLKWVCLVNEAFLSLVMIAIMSGRVEYLCTKFCSRLCLSGFPRRHSRLEF